MTEFTVKDSGQREEFDTGSRRDTREGKGRYDLFSPIALKRQALVYERGAQKYGDRNWEKGQPVSRYIDSALRHIFSYLAGMRDEDHLAQGAWNLHAAIHTEELLPHLQDIPAQLAALEEEIALPRNCASPMICSLGELERAVPATTEPPLESVGSGLVPNPYCLTHGYRHATPGTPECRYDAGTLGGPG